MVSCHFARHLTQISKSTTDAKHTIHSSQSSLILTSHRPFFPIPKKAKRLLSGLWLPPWRSCCCCCRGAHRGVCRVRRGRWCWGRGRGGRWRHRCCKGWCGRGCCRRGWCRRGCCRRGWCGRSCGQGELGGSQRLDFGVLWFKVYPVVRKIFSNSQSS